MFQALLAPLASVGSSIASGIGAAGSKAASLAGDGLSLLGKSSGALDSTGSFDWNGLANAALRTASGAGQGFAQGYFGKSSKTNPFGAPQIPLNFNFRNPFAEPDQPQNGFTQ